MSKVHIIRSVIAAAAVLSLMAVAPGPALADSSNEITTTSTTTTPLQSTCWGCRLSTVTFSYSIRLAPP